MRNIRNLIIGYLSKKQIILKFVNSVIARTDFLSASLVNDPNKRLLDLLGVSEKNKKSQINQDLFALLYFQFKRSGYFVEVGANDGYNLSNTLLLEAEYNWNGLLIEANPKYEHSLKTRKANVEICAVSDQTGRVTFVDGGLYGGISHHLDKTHETKLVGAKEISVYSTSITELLRKNSAPKIIDFISIDVEGCETTIVDQMFATNHPYEYLCGVIEVNRRKSDIDYILEILQGNGYKVLPVKQTKHDIFFYKYRT